MTSTTRSTSGSSTTAAASRVSTPSASSTSRSRRQVAHGDLGDLEAEPGAGLDRVGLLGEQAHERGADVAAAEHTDPDDVATASLSVTGGEGTRLAVQCRRHTSWGTR